MQIRASSFKGDHPLCEVDSTHPIHSHGCYLRYADCDTNLKQAIRRFLCAICRRTISVLPDETLPYRAVPGPAVEQYFGAQVVGGPPPGVSIKTEGCLKRAWARFKQRVEPLTTVLGQMISVVKPSAPQLWNQLCRQGNLAAILRQLARPFNTSLLHDYLCVRLWPKTQALRE